MKTAAAIVTNRGGRTCHAAIIARELGIPAVVGCGDATAVLHEGALVTVSCAEGDTGYVYDGLLETAISEVVREELPYCPVKIMMNVGNPQLAFDFAGFQDIFGKGLEDGFSAEVEAERVHPAKQKALAMTDGWEAIGKRVSAPFQTRPAFDLMDVLRHSPHSLRGIWALCAAGARLFSA